MAGGTSIASGAAWMILMRWSIRLIGLVSTVILARLLTPADFGIVAMAAMVVGLGEVVFEANAANVLIRKQDLDRGHYDTGWTIALLQAAILATLLIAAAPLAARYFEDERVTLVLQIVALAPVLRGLQNIGIVDFRKSLDFSRDFRFGVYSRLSSFIVTIVLAFTLRSYWALVIGILAASAAECLLSYTMHPFRPRPSLRHWREFVAFSAWMTPVAISRFINAKADVLVVGSLGDAAHTGAYNTGSEIARMATAEIIVPAGRALYPNFSNLQSDPAALVRAFLQVLGAASVVCMAFGVGLSLVAEDFVLVVLGYQWVFAIPIIRWLAISMALTGLLDVLMGHILIATHNERVLFQLHLVRTAIFLPAVIVAGMHWGVVEVAMASVLSTAIYFPIVILTIAHKLPLRVTQIIVAMFRPACAAGVMAGAVIALHQEHVAHPLISMSLDAAVGGASYCAALFTLWWMAGKPAGAERMLAGFLWRPLAAWVRGRTGGNRG